MHKVICTNAIYVHTFTANTYNTVKEVKDVLSIRW